MPGPQHSGRWSFWRGGGPDMSGPYAEASVGADAISARITAAVASPSYTPPAAPAQLQRQRQCWYGTASRPGSGHSAGVRRRRALRAAGSAKISSKQRRGALHRLQRALTAGQQTVLVEAGPQTARGLSRGPGRCRFAAANRPAPGGSRRSASSKSPRRRAGQTAGLGIILLIVYTIQTINGRGIL